MHTEDGCDRGYNGSLRTLSFKEPSSKPLLPKVAAGLKIALRYFLNLTVWALLTSLVKSSTCKPNKTKPQTFLSPALSPPFHLLFIFQKEEATAPASADTWPRGPPGSTPSTKVVLPPVAQSPTTTPHSPK